MKDKSRCQEEQDTEISMDECEPEGCESWRQRDGLAGRKLGCRLAVVVQSMKRMSMVEWQLRRDSRHDVVVCI